MEFIDLFAGVGGFRRGMELAGHKCVGFCEWDKFATASYTSMHLITEEQRKYLATLNLKKRQEEILKDEYRNGEWYSNDIRNVDAGSVPKADCWCFGAPCQDFSIAGKRAGLEGDRSSLIREVFRILREMPEENRPEWLIYENVKGMFSSNRGWDYLEILMEMDEGGYDIEWQLFNSKDFGVPQNRERVYTVGHLRKCGTKKIFPIEGTDGENRISMIAHRNGYRRNTQVFAPDGITEALDTGGGGGRGHYTAMKIEKIGTLDTNRHSDRDIVGIGGVIGTMQARDYKQPKTVAIPIADIKLPGKNYNQRKTVHTTNGVSRTLISNGHSGNEPKVAIPVTMGANVVKAEINTAHCLNANDSRKFLGKKQDGNAVVLPVLTPDRAEKRQNGRRFKDDGDPMFTLTGQDRHGVGIEVDGNDNTEHPGIYVQLSDDLTVYAIWYEKYQCYIAIRKLTPKECFRLQGWTDDYFEKAQFVNSDSQLYKQAGNGVTVNVVYEIGKRIKEYERNK
jgi:DNA (cytosine-5)-methyltransferase 1